MDRFRELSLLKTLRGVLDKMQIKVGVRFPCETADLRSAMEHGVEVVSAMVGANHSIIDLPEDLETLALLAAASKILADKASGFRAGSRHAEADTLEDIARELDRQIAAKLKGRRGPDDVRH